MVLTVKSISQAKRIDALSRSRIKQDAKSITDAKGRLNSMLDALAVKRQRWLGGGCIEGKAHSCHKETPLTPRRAVASIRITPRAL
jgi:hypothetical protein